MRKRMREFGILGGALLFWLLPAAAQVTVGDNLNLNLSGSLSFGYNGTFGDSSGHGLGLGGNGTLSGYYHNPKFISFRVQPYYNRSQSNSTFQSISNSSGFNSDASIFTGSHFPGSISFSKVYDSSGQFGIPGVSGLTTHGGGQAFSVTWSALLPKLPTVTATYALQSSNAEVYGAEAESLSNSRNFNLQSTYRLAGFHLQGFYTNQSLNATFPVLEPQSSEQQSNTGSSTVGLQASHAIPLHGQWFGGWSRSSFGGDYQSGTSTGSNDSTATTVNAGVSVNPLTRLTLSFNSAYNDNLFGTLQQQILQLGGAASINPVGREYASHAFSLSSSASYTVFSHLSVTGRWSRSQQYFNGDSHTIEQYGGTANFRYAQRFLGSLTFSVGVVDSATQLGNTGASLISDVNFSRRLHGWDVDASFNYAQQVQTLLAIYMTSSYGYGARARRRFNDRLTVSGGFSGRHSGMTPQEGTSNHSESFSGGLGYGRYAVSGNYSRSSGISVLTPQGLVAIPSGVPAPLVAQQTLYNASSFGIGGGATVKRLNVSLSYANAHSQVQDVARASSFKTKMLTGRLEYRLRKMYLNSGFTRFQQDFGAGRSRPTDINTYFIGISRWFNVF